MTNAESKALERKRKRDLGLIRVEVWINKEKKEEFKKLVSKLNG